MRSWYTAPDSLRLLMTHEIAGDSMRIYENEVYIHNYTGMNIIVIEDEDLAAEDLINTLKRVEPNAVVEQRLTSVENSIAYLEKNKSAQLIFSDIQLGDGLSFEIYERIKIEIPIVFYTAYHEYMLQAFRNNGIDYLLKPLSEDAVRHTMHKYYGLKRSMQSAMPDWSTLYRNLAQESSQRVKSILVNYQDKIIPLQMAEVALFYIQHENVLVKTNDGKEYLVSKSLDELDKSLGTDFYRVNRQHIVNRSVIRHASYSLARKLVLDIKINHDIRILVSREKSGSFLQWLGGE